MPGRKASGTTVISPQDWLRKPGSVGRPVNGVTVHITGEDGRGAAAGRDRHHPLRGRARASPTTTPRTRRRACFDDARLGDARRSRLAGRGRLPVPVRPSRRPDPVGRRQPLSGGGRGGAGAAPGRSRRSRWSACRMRRWASRCMRWWCRVARCDAGACGAGRLVPGPAGRAEAAAQLGVRRGIAAQRSRQTAAADPEGALPQPRLRPSRLTRASSRSIVSAMLRA